MPDAPTSPCPTCRRSFVLGAGRLVPAHDRIPGFPSQGRCASSGLIWSTTIFPARLDTDTSR